MKRIALHFEFASSKNSEPPSEFRIFPAGVVETTKGLFKFDGDSAVGVMKRASDWGNDYPIDYDHAMVDFWSSADPAEKGKAAGWFTPEVRNGELWATKVSWTPKAREFLSNREYRYFSPTFLTDDEGRIVELVNIALTNLPATKGMDPLVANRAGEPPQKEKPIMKTLLIALGLAETATEAEALAALTRHLEQGRSLATLTAKESAAEALAVVQAWKAGSEQAAALAAKIAESEKAAAAREVEELIATAKREGKVSPAMEPAVREMAGNIKALKAFLEAMPKLVGAGASVAPGSDKGAAVTLSQTELEILAKTGTDPKKYAEEKARLVAAGYLPATA